MKFRYQLRGLGIGMVLTALLMGVAAGDGNSMSDAEIKARALELGMIESDSLKLTDIVPTQMPGSIGGSSSNSGEGATLSSSNSDGVPTREPLPDSNQDSMQGSLSNPGEKSTQESLSNSGEVPAQATPLPIAEGISAQTPSSNHDGASTQVSSSNSVDANVITVVIEQGEIASEICVKLEAAGVIGDAAAFETYLCENNWSRSIRDGIYNIPSGTSMEDVAEIITKNP